MMTLCVFFCLGALSTGRFDGYDDNDDGFDVDDNHHADYNFKLKLSVIIMALECAIFTVERLTINQ